MADLTYTSFGTYSSTDAFVRTTGYSVPGDGGACDYRKLSPQPGTPPTDPWYVEDQDGDWWIMCDPAPNVRQFGALGDGVADDGSALADAFAAFNEAHIGELHFPKGEYGIKAALPPITAKGGSITGCYGASSIVILASTTSKTFSQFLQLGIAGGTFADNVSIENLKFQCLNMPAADPTVTGYPIVNSYVIDVPNARECRVDNIIVVDVAGLVRYGSSTDKAKRTSFSRWYGTCTKGGNTEGNILIQNGSGGLFQNWKINASAFCDSGSIVLIDAVEGVESVDAFIFSECTFQMFFDNGGTPAGGKPWGVRVDSTSGDVTNLWIDKCVFDHTTSAGFLMKNDTGASFTSRNISISNSRFSTDDGIGIQFSMNSPPYNPTAQEFTPLMRGVRITNNHIITSSASPAIQFRALGARETVISNNCIMDNNPGIEKPYAIIVRSMSFNITDNRIGSNVQETGFVTAVRVENTLSNDFLISGNGATGVTAFESHVSLPPSGWLITNNVP